MLKGKIHFILLFLTLCGCTSQPHQDIQQDNTLSIIFTGDVLLDRGVRKQIERKGLEYLLSAVQDTFKTADATIINLECPFAEASTPVVKKFVFKADPVWAKTLRKAGITHAAMANNHTYDQGGRGLLCTKQTLDKAGIKPLGFGFNRAEQIKPVEIKKNNTKVAIFNSVLFRLENWFTQENGPGICQAPSAMLAATITQYKKQHPNTKVIVVLHWGVEFSPYPSIQQQHDAINLRDAGADVIIGHHPHIIQPAMKSQQSTIIYSLGNFVFDQKRKEGNIAEMAKVIVNKDSIRVKTLDVNIEQCRPVPTGNWKDVK